MMLIYIIKEKFEYYEENEEISSSPLTSSHLRTIISYLASYIHIAFIYAPPFNLELKARHHAKCIITLFLYTSSSTIYVIFNVHKFCRRRSFLYFFFFFFFKYLRSLSVTYYNLDLREVL